MVLISFLFALFFFLVSADSFVEEYWELKGSELSMVLKVTGRALESDAEARLAGGGREGEPRRSLYILRETTRRVG